MEIKLKTGSLVRYKRQTYALKYALDEGDDEATLVNDQGKERCVGSAEFDKIEPYPSDPRLEFLARLALAAMARADRAMEQADHHPDPVFGY